MKSIHIIFALFLFINNTYLFAQGSMVSMMHHYGHYIYDIEANDQGQVWTAGDNQIMYSSNNGDDWTNINFPFPSARLRHIAVLSTEEIFVAGREFYRTEDGGETWEANADLTQIEDIFLFDQTIFVARGIDGESVMRSDDLGKNWMVIEPIDIERAVTISFLSSTIGHCSDLNGTIYKTSDAGENWTVINDNDFTEEIKLITFRNEDEAYLLQEKNFYQSTDLGTNWTLLDDDVSTQVKALFATPTEIITLDSRYKSYNFDTGNFNTIIDKEDYDLIWMNGFKQTSNFQFVTGNGVVMRKPINEVWDDWTDLTPGPNIGFDHIAYNDEKIVLGGPQRTQISEDNGVTFTQQTSPGFTYFEDMTVLPNGHIYVATNALRKSEDNGENWEYVIQGTLFKAFDNDNFIRYYNGSIYRSDDAGVTWDSLFANPSFSPKSMHFYDNNFGWLFNGSNTARRTYDGGTSWEIVEFDSNSPTFGQFVNPQVGFGLRKYSASFYKTIDGGDNWELSGVDIMDDLIDLHFEDELHGWVAGAIGEQGAIYETFDGGNTWSLFQLGIDEFMRISKNEFTNEIWAIGRSAQLYKYAICDNLTPVISQSEDRIICSEAGSSYKWYYENEFLVETMENYLDVIALGEYSVRVVGDENCVSESSEGLSVISNVDQLKPQQFAHVFPNPNNGSFSISISDKLTVENINLFSSTGQEMAIEYGLGNQVFDISTSGLSKGIYFLSVQTANAYDVIRMVIQ